MDRASLGSAVACVLCAAVVGGCAFEFSDIPSRPHGSTGAEIFRVLCMDMAAQSFPSHLTGDAFSARCDGKQLGDAPELELEPKGDDERRAYARYQALVARRERLVEALDATFDEQAYRPDELRDFIAEMVPLYDPPEQLPAVTRSVSTLLQQLLDPQDAQGADALAALARVSSREGYRPAAFDLALTRALLRYPKLDEVVRTTLAAIASDGPARGPYEDLLRAGALDMVTAERQAAEPAQLGTLSVSMDLLLREADDFAGADRPFFMTRRDARGAAHSPTGEALPPPTNMPPVTPYATFDPGPTSSVARDDFGRAVDAEGNPLYASFDADRTLLAGLLREAGPLLTRGASGQAPLLDFTYGMNALLGDYGRRTHPVGATSFAFEGPDTDRGPLFDFVHALSSTLPFAQTDELLEVFQRLVRDHERELSGLIEAVLYIKERSDAYPDARFEKPHDFWDGMLAWAIQLTERPDLLARMLRALGDEQTAKAGPLMGNFMRYRDRVNYPLGSREELEALGIFPSQVIGKLAADCQGPACGKACDLTNRCPTGLACVVGKEIGNPSGKCGSIADAVAAHRINVNYPCSNPPTALLGEADPEPGCLPQVDHPAPHHRGIRGCPAEKPEQGASCADVGGVGLCSWDGGSCTCDCAGGVCRHGAKPTWRCTNEPTPGYAEWVDRTQPDLRVGENGRSNQSLFQRTVALIHDLHVPAKWCSKEGASLIIYEPAGTNNKLLGPITLFGPYPECGLLNERSIVEIFARTITGTAELKLQNDVVAQLLGLVDDLNLGFINSDMLMERQSQVRGLTVKPPKPHGVARTVFSPYVPFAEDLLGLTPSRDGHNIVDLHQDTIMAWELADPVSGGSYYTVLKPFLAAMDPSDGKGQSNLDLYGDIISLAHKHWSSRATDSSKRECEAGSTPLRCDEQADLFAFQSNLVSYEELVAEALVDARLMSRMRDFSLALSAIHLPNGKDGIAVFADAVFNLLQPRRSCLDQDCTAQPLRYRDGRATTQTNTGQPLDAVSPIYLLLDALNAIDARFEGPQAERLRPWRDARSKIVDVFFDVVRDAPEQWRFKSQRGRALLFESVGFLRRRLAQYQREQDACATKGAGSGLCHQVHDGVFGWAPRLASSLGQPVSAAALRLLDRLREVDSDPAGKFADLAAYLTTDKPGEDTFAAMLLGTTDLLQVLQDNENVGPLMAFGARAIAANAAAVASGKGGELAIDAGALEQTLTLLRSLQDVAPESATSKSTLASLLERLARGYRSSGETPLDVVIETIAEVNRAVPSERGGGPLSGDDLRALLGETEHFLSSKRHGLERLYDIVQSRELP